MICTGLTLSCIYVFLAILEQLLEVCVFLSQVLPDSLQLMGRIAHVQVWDYMDKLRSSSSRVSVCVFIHCLAWMYTSLPLFSLQDIVVIRFECLNGETDAYMSMFNYFLRKHRCGVISSSYYGIKDMYLVPLPSYRDVAPQLLPFKGPGTVATCLLYRERKEIRSAACL